MTAILGFVHRGTVYVFADSAVTTRGQAQTLWSSFGEAQQVDTLAIEEQAMKLQQVGGDALVAEAGDAAAAHAFVDLLRVELDRGNAVRETLEGFEGAFSSGHRFVVLCACRAGGETMLLRYDSHGSVEATDYATAGSIPEGLKQSVWCLIQQLTQKDLPSETLQMAVLASLQSLGVTTHLPAHGIGGAFFGARLGETELAWSPPVSYLMCAPGVFNSKKTQDASLMHGAVNVVRVRSLDGSGITNASFGEPSNRVFPAPGSSLSDEEWRPIVLGDREPLAVHEYRCLLSKAYPRALLLIPSEDGDSALLFRRGEDQLVVDTRVRGFLDEKPQSGHRELHIVFETDFALRERLFF